MFLLQLILRGSRSLLSLTQEIIFESFTAILYDVILFSTITERFGEIQLFEEVRTL